MAATFVRILLPKPRSCDDNRSQRKDVSVRLLQKEARLLPRLKPADESTAARGLEETKEARTIVSLAKAG